MALIRSHPNRSYRAMLCTKSAARAIITNLIINQCGAFARRTMPFEMRFVLIAEVPQGSKHGVGSGSSQTTKTSSANLLTKPFQFLEVLRLALSGTESIKNIKHAARADSAKGAFAAGLVLCELEEIPGDVHHACGIVQHDQATRPHDRTDLAKGFVIHWGIGKTRRNATTPRTTDLDRLELASRSNATADFFHNLPNGCSHRNFNQAAPLDISCQGKNFCSFAFHGPVGSKCFCTMAQNPGNHGQRLDIIDNRRFSPKTLFDRERWAQTGHAPLAFDRSNKRGFFTANKRSGSFFDRQSQRILRPQQALPNPAPLFT